MLVANPQKDSFPINISVIVPIYNVEKYLHQCLDSCHRQSMAEVEFICINDGSTDSSLEIIKEFASLDNRFIIINQKNCGIASARNTGLDAARGKYIMFLDSDDFLEPNACERVWQELLSNPADIVIFSATLVPAEVAPNPWYKWVLTAPDKRYDFFSPQVLFDEPTTRPFIWHQAFNKKLLDDNHLRFCEKVKIGEDMAFVLQTYPHANTFSFISDHLVNYRWVRDGSLMDKFNDICIDKRIEIHLQLSAIICDYWTKMNWTQKYGKAFLEWLLVFILVDVEKPEVKQREKHIQELTALIDKHGLSRHLNELSARGTELSAHLNHPKGADDTDLKGELLMNDNKHYDVGLVGWWFSSNYGSALTYYGLGKMLQDLDYSSIMLQLSKVNKTPWEPQVQKSIDFMRKHFPISEKLPIEDNGKFNELCDTFILGSDQLWNKLGVDLLGYTFFLDFVNDNKKKMAYATSFGNSQFEGSKEQKDYIHYLLSKFDYISVREASGVKASKEAFNVNVERDLDPVFVCDRKHYDALADSCGKIEEDNNYLFTYILDVNEEKQKAIEYAAQKLGLRVISALDMRIPEDKKAAWHTGELKDDLSIEEFVYYIKNCKYMITDSHHGACFAMIYNKDLLTISNSGRGLTRFTHLFNLFKLNHRLVHNVEDVYTNDDFFKPTDYKEFNKILKQEKKVSLNRFKDALKKPKTEKSFSLFKKAPVPAPESVLDAMNKDPDFVKIRMLATLLRDYGIKHVVLSPGGRDVPLVRMFEYNEGTFTIHRVTDERSAAYYGLGIAAQLQEPVACVCTSGTAASNYLPAVTEAYFTGVPLIMITADRRDVYHGQGEDQTIPQKHIFDGVIKKSISLPEGSGYHADYQTRRDIQDCILESTHNGFGPVHINISIDNITVGASAPRNCWALLPRVNPHLLRVGPCDGDAAMMKWVDALKNSKRILIVYGQNAQPTAKQKENIERFASKYNCVIVTDHIANLNCSYSLKPFNMLGAVSNVDFNDNLAPDILITVGGKTLMNDPLTFKVRGGPGSIRHWSVTPDGKVKDFFFRLTSVLEMSQDYFFQWFADHAGNISNNGEYYNKWKLFNDRYKTPVETNYNSLYIQSKFFPAIPENSVLHLGVGQTFFFCRRYEIKDSVQVFCNMGTNGIDGCTSTFMGQCAVEKNKLCFLLVGDLSFFYDMNGIWNKQPAKNVRILLVNNNGSGLLGGHGLKAIRSTHNTEAKGWVESTGFEYISARTPAEYEEKLKYFLSDKSDKALFFEVFCN